jgi:hypothetical protein
MQDCEGQGLRNLRLGRFIPDEAREDTKLAGHDSLLVIIRLVVEGDVVRVVLAWIVDSASLTMDTLEELAEIE